MTSKIELTASETLAVRTAKDLLSHIFPTATNSLTNALYRRAAGEFTGFTAVETSALYIASEMVRAALVHRQAPFTTDSFSQGAKNEEVTDEVMNLWVTLRKLANLANR
jgi:hypothetical protein